MPSKCARLKQRLQILVEEGVADVLVHDAYQEALQVYVAHGDYAHASALAALAARCQEVRKGPGADGLEDIRSYIKSPQSHPLVGKSNRGRTKVKGCSAARIGWGRGVVVGAMWLMK